MDIFGGIEARLIIENQLRIDLYLRIRSYETDNATSAYLKM